MFVLLFYFIVVLVCKCFNELVCKIIRKGAKNAEIWEVEGFEGVEGKGVG